MGALFLPAFVTMIPPNFHESRGPDAEPTWSATVTRRRKSGRRYNVRLVPGLVHFDARRFHDGAPARMLGPDKGLEFLRAHVARQRADGGVLVRDLSCLHDLH